MKDPAMLLSIANSVGLVGTTAYFYKQLEAIRLDMAKLSNTLTGVLRKVAEIDKGDQHKNEAIHALNDQMRKINDQIEELPSLDMTENMELDLSEIISVLEENNIAVDRPSQQVLKPRRGNDRRASSRRSEPEVEDRRDTRRRPAREYDSKPRTSTREQPRESTRPAPRNEPVSYEDDEELIGEVRRQQPTRLI